jgi:hypothetical protein
VIFEVDSATVPYCFGCYGGAVDIKGIINTSEGTKLFLQKRNLQWGTGIQTYSLCGKLPMKTYEFTNNSNRIVKIYPNPAQSKLTFELTPPNNLEEFQILIYDNNAKELTKESVRLIQNKYLLDVGSFINGTYFFSLVSKSNNKVYETGKFIITK